MQEDKVTPSRFRFRAWSPFHKTWANRVRMDSCGHHETLFFGISDPYIAVPDDIVFMQSTGLLDRNGKEIFEGDILESYLYKPERIRLAVVKFGEGHFDSGFYKYQGFHLVSADEEQYEQGWMLTDDDFEIIGNIYENPELLGTINK